jgi:hypothetical protein
MTNLESESKRPSNYSNFKNTNIFTEKLCFVAVIILFFLIKIGMFISLYCLQKVYILPFLRAERFMTSINLFIP